MNKHIVLMAEMFAKGAHKAIAQKRKYSGDCYTTHLGRVVKRLRATGADDEMLAAGWLHDVVEDSKVTKDDVYDIFGVNVGAMVSWLTDDFTEGNRAFRKEQYRQQIAKASARTKTIKLADLLDNTSSIVQYDRGFAKVYLKEKAALLEVLKEGDARLYAEAQEVLTKGLKELEND